MSSLKFKLTPFFIILLMFAFFVDRSAEAAPSKFVFLPKVTNKHADATKMVNDAIDKLTKAADKLADDKFDCSSSDFCKFKKNRKLPRCIACAVLKPN